MIAMPIKEQLYLRALRLLNDKLGHAPAAVAWARSVAGCRLDETDIPADPRRSFTLRELSLGAAEVVSL